MIYRLLIPDVGDVTEVRMLEWHGEPGAAFNEGDLVAELETHKVVIEVRAGQSGILRQILVEEGEWKQAGQSIGVFSDTADETLMSPEPATNPFPAEFAIV